MNTAQAVELKKDEESMMGGFVKLYAHGKIGLLFDGPEAYRKVAEACFKRALDIRVTVNDIEFVRAMRDQGVPEAVIKQFLDTCSLIDEVHLGGLSLQ